MLKKLILCALFVSLLPIPMPAEQLSGDVNCDEAVDILDVVHLINYKYKEGDPPCPIRYPETPIIVVVGGQHTPSFYGWDNPWTSIKHIKKYPVNLRINRAQDIISK